MNLRDRLLLLDHLVNKTLHIPATVVLGGSRAIGEAVEGSDTDVYVLAHSLFGLARLLRKKKLLASFRDTRMPGTQMLLGTTGLVRYGFLYVYGRDTHGRTVASSPDLLSLRLDMTKKAAYEFIRSTTAACVAPSYHMSKALKMVLGARGIRLHISPLMQMPFFSRKKIRHAVHDLLPPAESGPVQELFIHTLSQHDRPLTPRDIALVRRLVLGEVQEGLRAPLSIRSYLLYTLFALRRGRVWQMLQNPDRQVLAGFQRCIETGDMKEFSALEQQCAMTLVI